MGWQDWSAGSVTSGDAKPKYSQSQVPPAKLHETNTQTVSSDKLKSLISFDVWRVKSKLHSNCDIVEQVRVCCPSNLRLGASGESLGATPLATEARNSCLFCCTRHAARMILWHGVRKYGRFTFCAKSSVTISKSVCGEERQSRLSDLNKSEWLKVRADDLKFCFCSETGLWRQTKSHNELLLSLLCAYHSIKARTSAGGGGWVCYESPSHLFYRFPGVTTQKRNQVSTSLVRTGSHE